MGGELPSFIDPLEVGFTSVKHCFAKLGFLLRWKDRKAVLTTCTVTKSSNCKGERTVFGNINQPKIFTASGGTRGLYVKEKAAKCLLPALRFRVVDWKVCSLWFVTNARWVLLR